MIKIKRIIEGYGGTVFVGYDPNDRRANRDINLTIGNSAMGTTRPIVTAEIDLSIETAEALIASLTAAIKMEAR